MNARRVVQVAALLCCIGPLGGCIPKDGPAERTAPLKPLPPEGRAAFYVRVEPGESLQQIARTYHVPLRDIVNANRLTVPYAVHSGELIEVPLTAAGRTLHVATHKRSVRMAIRRRHRMRMARHGVHHKRTVADRSQVAGLRSKPSENSN